MGVLELIVRIVLALIFPPLGLIALPRHGCGTFLLVLLLTLCFYVPGQIVAIVIIASDFSESRHG